MSSTERELWEGIVDREALGETLSADERARRDALARSDGACAAETEVYRVLGAALGRGSRPADADDRLIQTALRASASESAPVVPAARASRTRVTVVVAVMSCLAAAAVMFITRAPVFEGPAAKHAASVPEQSAPASEAERVARLVSVEGSVLIDGESARGGAGVALGSRVQIGTGRACLAFERDVIACAGAGSDLRVIALGLLQELELSKGHLVAVLKSQPAGAHFAVSTLSGVVRAVGTVFAVEVAPAFGTTLRVAEGSVAARTSGAERLVEPGQSLVLGSGEASPARSSDVDRDRALVSSMPSFAPALAERAARSLAAAPRASASATPVPRADAAPADLLELASKARSRGAYPEAARHYERLVSAHAGTPEGRAATIGLAELRLSRLGEPARALALFERYLAAGGSLSQEAHYGKIQALRALGRARDAEREVAAFLELYPKSAYAGSLRKSK